MATSDINTPKEHAQVLLLCFLKEHAFNIQMQRMSNGILYISLFSSSQSITPLLHSTSRRGNTHCLHVQSSPLNSEPDWETKVHVFIIKLIVLLFVFIGRLLPRIQTQLISEWPLPFTVGVVCTFSHAAGITGQLSLRSLARIHLDRTVLPPYLFYNPSVPVHSCCFPVCSYLL